MDTKIDIQDNPVTLTEAARAAFQDILQEINADETHFVRVYITGGGCSGLMYGMAVDDSADDLDKRFSIDGIPIVIDAITIKYITGSLIDYTDGFQGAFKVNNPNATRACGCSNSFSVDDVTALDIDNTRYGACATCPSTKPSSA